MIDKITIKIIKTGILRWPFRCVDGVIETYKNILFYTPVLFTALLSLTFLKQSGLSFTPLFKWRRFSKIFWVGLRLALPAFCYGFLLGIIMEKDKSVLPCIACHFFIDTANIGLPLLIDLPVG